LARERATLSKRLRFEIFKRDNFRCKYCGSSPTVRPLHVDHVVPVVEGGTDDPENLVTSCEPCNLGKAAVPLDAKRHANAVGELTEAQSEHGDQIRAWIEAQRDREAAREDLREMLCERWEKLAECRVPSRLDLRFVAMAEEFGVERLREAFSIIGDKGIYGQDAAKYLGGILRNWRVPKTRLPTISAEPYQDAFEELYIQVAASLGYEFFHADAQGRAPDAEKIIQGARLVVAEAERLCSEVRDWERKKGGGK
jgi:hypothetical protein